MSWFYEKNIAPTYKSSPYPYGLPHTEIEITIVCNDRWTLLPYYQGYGV